MLTFPLIIGCGDSGGVNAPVVAVSAAQRAKDVSATANQTVTWLEGLPASDRQAAVDRAPQIKSVLKDATDPAIKERISRLGIHF